MSKLTFEDYTKKPNKNAHIVYGLTGMLPITKKQTIIHGAHLAEQLRWRDSKKELPEIGETYMVDTRSINSDVTTWLVSDSSDVDNIVRYGYHYRPFIEGIDTP